jgi:tetratricopeptide (TPR) repeat protein
MKLFEFQDVLRTTLEHFNDRKWLEQNSPFCTASLLEKHWDKYQRADKKVSLGATLQHLLLETARAFWDTHLPKTIGELERLVDEDRKVSGNRSHRYLFLVLELRYFRKYFHPNSSPIRTTDIAEYLHVSSASFFLHLENALKQYSEKLLTQLHPHTDVLPIPKTYKLYGRDETLRYCSLKLMNRQSLTLYGPPGIGKTQIGAHIASQWKEQPVFWFTFHKGINVHPQILMIHIAQYLYKFGQHLLWLSLFSQPSSNFNFQRALGLLESELWQLASRLDVLFCFDNVDLLQFTSLEDGEAYDQHPLLEIIQLVGKHFSILVISTQPIIFTKYTVAVSGLSPIEMQRWVEDEKIHYQPEIFEKWVKLSNGNPRLFQLQTYTVLEKHVPIAIHENNLFTAFFQSIWLQLSPQQQELLILYSVFRFAVPTPNRYLDNQATEKLLSWQLLTKETPYTIQISDWCRLEIEKIPHLDYQVSYAHQIAAQVRNELGEITAACYHLVAIHQYDMAVNLWFKYKDVEMQQGKTFFAFHVFDPITLDQVLEENRPVLLLIKNDIYALLGKLDKVKSPTAVITHPTDIDIATEGQSARAQMLLGNLDSAEASYEKAFGYLMSLESQAAKLLWNWGQMHISQSDILHAEHTSSNLLLRHKQLQGLIYLEQNELNSAELCYQEALELAAKLNDNEAIISTQNQLAVTYAMQLRINDAIFELQKSETMLKKQGDLPGIAFQKANLSAIFLKARSYQSSIWVGEQSYQEFCAMNHKMGMAMTATNLAIAYFYQKELTKALEYTQLVMDLDISFYRPFALLNLGRIHIAQNQPHQAFSFLQTAQSLAEERKNSALLGYILTELGNAFEQVGKADLSAENWHSALKIFDTLGITDEIALLKTKLHHIDMIADHDLSNQ